MDSTALTQPGLTIERVAAMRSRRKQRATIDFETRSAADIRNGPWSYSIHPSTRILCLSFLLPGQDPTDPSVWVAPVNGIQLPHHYPSHPDGGRWDLERLFDYIRAGGLVEAHNVGFERAIWENIFAQEESWDQYGSLGVGAPHLVDRQLRCSAAKAAAFALPRDLGGVGAALNLTVRKDEEGARVMMSISRARKPRKTEPTVDDQGNALWYYRAYDADEMRRLYRYCANDVMAEHAVSEALPDLTDFEYKVWLADLRANWRGVRIDMDLVDSAIYLDAKVKEEMNTRLWELTGIERGTNRGQILAWLQEKKLPVYDTTAGTMDWLLAHPDFEDWHPDIQEVIRIARNINRTSITKFKRIKACVDVRDMRVRDLIMYHGATTGRWAGKGIQVQNFPKGNITELLGVGPYHAKKNPHGWTMQMVTDHVKTRDLAWCRSLYGDVLALLSSVARATLIPTEGKVFYVADYSAIEARVVLWLAGAESAMQVFLSSDPDVDIYTDMASTISQRRITKANKNERQFGKVTILGLGYGMGFLTFLLNIRTYDIDLPDGSKAPLSFTEEQARSILGDKWEKYTDWVRQRLWPTEPDPANYSETGYADAVKRYRANKRQAAMDLRRLEDAREVPANIIHELAVCKFTVDTYRAKYKEVPALWQAQEDAATKAVMEWEKERDLCAAMGITDPALFDLKPVPAGKVTWVVDESYLFCILPSGRRLVYNNPTLKYVKTPWGKKRAELRFKGVHKKLKRWADMATYGGSLVENIDQATARDMMAYAFVQVDEHPDYEPIASIHDELLSEGDEVEGRYKEYEHILVTLPAIYDGCPIAAEGDMLYRYQK